MNFPQHIAFICDGNRRWALKKGLPEFAGHKQAVEVTIDQLVDHSIKLHIPYLSFWVLSTENWLRGKDWINRYFKLMHYFFKTKLKKLIAKGVKVKIIGNLTQLPKNIQKILKELEKKSQNNKKITVIIAINYGGRDEIVRAINKLLAKKGPALDKGRAFTLEKEFANYLDTTGIPDPDLLIRTGEANVRLSGFMLWQIAYTELYFTNTLFPDFTPQKLDEAIAWLQHQKRNFGK